MCADKIDQQLLEKKEKDMKKEYKTLHNILKQAKDMAERESKKEEMRKRMEKNAFSKVGRPPMERSKKKAVKKQVKEPIFDQETHDIKRYLGDF